MTKAIIFDFFGVILTDALQAMCDRLAGSDPAACERAKDIIKATNRGMLDPAEANRQLAALLGTDESGFRAMKSEGEVRNRPLLGLIAELHRDYRTAILSNATVGSLERRFDRQELDTLFDALVVSADIGYIKPEPEAYLTAAARLGVEPSECIFTDDRDAFCDAARATGMQAIHYQSFDQFREELEALLM